MDNSEYLDEIDENDDFFEDVDEIEEDEDILFNEEIDDSAKKAPVPNANEIDKSDEDTDNDDEEINKKITIKTKERRKYNINYKISKEEYTGLIAHIAEKIADSILLVPDEFEELFDTKSGSSITIATNWVLNYKKCPIPGLYIIRNNNGIEQKINPGDDKFFFEYELNCFESVSEKSFYSNFTE